MFKATYINETQMTKREQNLYLDQCEVKLKENCIDFVCLEKIKKHPRYEIVFSASAVKSA